jgi:hypothetical protein
MNLFCHFSRERRIAKKTDDTIIKQKLKALLAKITITHVVSFQSYSSPPAPRLTSFCAFAGVVG